MKLNGFHFGSTLYKFCIEKVNFVTRENLNIFTKISLFTALVAVIVIPPFTYISSKVSNVSVESILQAFISIAFLASVFGIPLSIVSMFSKEKLVKRIFALVINLLPLSLIIYAFVIEFINA